MALRRVFVDRVSDGEAHVEGPAAHHLARVVRLREGEEVELSDGSALFRARVAKAGSRRVEFAIEEELAAPALGPDVTLRIAVFQFPRLEWALEKATELGVARVVPIVAARSEKHLVKTAPKRMERWRRITEQAAQQSRRMSSPVIEEAVSFEKVIVDRQGTGLILHPDGDPLGDILASCVPGPIQLLVGPEGGWTDDEVSSALAAGYQQAGMGSLILRCETAAVAALSIISQVCR